MITTFLLTILTVFIIWVVSNQASTRWVAGKTIKTPDEHFTDLPDYPFTPNYVNVLGYDVHYVDEGAKDAQVILLMHGQPSWSYLYRKMIPLLVDAGYRVIAPDLVGFGKSAKPIERKQHNMQMHIDTMSELVSLLKLNGAVFFGQDWGGLIGLRVVANMPDTFSAIVLSNTGLPQAKGIKGWLAYPLFKLAVWREGKPEKVADKGKFRFTRWVAWAATTPNFDLLELFQSSTATKLSDAELKAYQAPFPDERYMAAIRTFPSMVPSQLRQNARAINAVFKQWEKPLITCFSDADPVTKGLEVFWQKTVPGAKGQAHTKVKGAHFVQEDSPADLVEAIIKVAG